LAASELPIQAKASESQHSIILAIFKLHKLLRLLAWCEFHEEENEMNVSTHSLYQQRGSKKILGAMGKTYERANFKTIFSWHFSHWIRDLRNLAARNGTSAGVVGSLEICLFGYAFDIAGL
jgi:hypothetical protein